MTNVQFLVILATTCIAPHMGFKRAHIWSGLYLVGAFGFLIFGAWK